jgi:hypothetical protein
MHYLESLNKIDKARREGAIGEKEAIKMVELANEAHINRLKEIDKQIKQLAIESGNEMAASFQKVIAGIGTGIDLAENAIDSIFTMIDSKDFGEVVATGADLVTQVGQALLTAPPPLSWAGAALVGVGMVGKAIKAVIDFVEQIITRTDKVYQKELDRIDTMERQLIIYKQEEQHLENILELNEKINQQYKARLDTAEEQERSTREEMMLTMNALSDLISKFDKAGIDIELPDTTDYDEMIGFLADVQKMSEDAQREIDKQNRLIESGSLTKKQKKNAEARIEALQLEIDMYDPLIDNIKNQLDLLAQLDELRRQAIQDRIDEKDHEFTVYEMQQKKLLLLGQITEEEFNERLNKKKIENLEQQLDIHDELVRQAQKDFANELITQQELWAIQDARMQLELEILGLKQAQNEEDTEALDKLRQMHMERQALILAAREEGVLGTDERARIQALEKQIIDEMTATGASPEAIAAAIEAFRASMPAFEIGTPFVPSDMAAMVHKGERILSSTEWHRDQV